MESLISSGLDKLHGVTFHKAKTFTCVLSLSTRFEMQRQEVHMSSRLAEEKLENGPPFC